MSKFSLEQETVRKYLLGNLGDAGELRRIEENILLNDEFAEQISIAEDEMIEEFLDGELSAEESESFRQFFLAVPERRQKLALIESLRNYAARNDFQPEVQNSENEVRARFGWFLLPEFIRFAVAVLFVGVIGVIVWRAVFYESDTDKGLAQLSVAYRGTRPLESRSTADFGYAPFTVTRGETVSPTDSNALDRAERFLLDAAKNPSDAEARHALGLFYLNEKQFDKALDEFNIALKISTDNAKLNSDVGAVFLEKAKQAESLKKYDETTENLARSLESINRALQIDQTLPEALFNKALILEEMRLPNEARQAWQKYIETDSASEWTNEAQKNLDKLKQPENQTKDKPQILDDFLDAFRRRDDEQAWKIASQTKEMITGVMIQQQFARKFLEADRQSRKEEAEEILSAFLYLGELEKQKSGDPYFSVLARVYATANSAQKSKLFEAHQKLDEGYQLLTTQNFKKADEIFRQSRELFLEAGSKPESFFAVYQIAYCQTQIGDPNESNRILFEAISELEEKNFWLKALFYGWLGSNFSNLGEFSQAIVFDKQSLDTAQKISDTYNIQRSLNQLSNEYRRIGNLPETFNHNFRGMLNSDYYYLPPRQQSRNLYFFTQAAVEAGFYDSALAFALENLNLIETVVKDQGMRHAVKVQIGTIRGKTGQYQNSVNEFESSLEIARTFPDEAKIKQLSARSLLSLANMQRENNKCAAAVENYDKALAIYRTTDFSANIYEAEKGKLLCDVAQNNETAVREKMPEILRSFDEYRGKLRESERTVFFDAEQNVYDAAVGYFYTTLKKPDEAFNYSENSRSRTLLGLMQGGSEPARTLSLADVQGKMPPGVQIIYYTVLPDKLLIWRISKNSVETVEKIISQEDLSKSVDEYRKYLTTNSDQEKTRQTGEKLYELLVSPVEKNLEKDAVICFIGDKNLFQVPFASLISPKSGKYLIEDFPVMLAPGATVFIEQSELARQKNQSPEETILSIGNPAFSRRQYPGFADLPTAETEAVKVAGLYAEKIILKRKQAGKQTITENFDKAEVIHFAGHYVPNFKKPALSKFLLSADSADQSAGELPVGEIIERKLPATKLVVLSACETGVENFYNGEGMIGAARAFFAAGVPLVVASQWSVDSDATAELMSKFHNYRKRENLKTVEALRRAQIDMLRDENPMFRKPFYWSGFLPIGGFADF